MDTIYAMARQGGWVGWRSYPHRMPLISRIGSGRVRRLEEQMRAMNSKIDAMAETFESRQADDEAAAIAAERIRSSAADHKEDGAEALAKLGIELPKG